MTPASASACKVQIFVEVPFSKKTMWKTFIEKGVREGCINSYTAWRDMVRGLGVASLNVLAWCAPRRQVGSRRGPPRFAQARGSA